MRDASVNRTDVALGIITFVLLLLCLLVPAPSPAGSDSAPGTAGASLVEDTAGLALRARSLASPQTAYQLP